MFCVYIIKSEIISQKFYVGYTLNVSSRIKKHNEGGSVYTKDYRPWELVMFLGFANKHKALAFEKYLKSHAGRAFMKKRFC